MSAAEIWIAKIPRSLPEGFDVADATPEAARALLSPENLVQIHPLPETIRARVAAAARRVGLMELTGRDTTEIVVLAAEGRAALVELAANAAAREKQVLRAAWLVSADHEGTGSNSWPSHAQ